MRSVVLAVLIAALPGAVQAQQQQFAARGGARGRVVDVTLFLGHPLGASRAIAKFPSEHTTHMDDWVVFPWECKHHADGGRKVMNASSAR